MQPDIHDLYYLARKGSWDARKKGESDQSFRLIMAAALVFIGATMAMDAWNKKPGRHGGPSL